jgi:hypothetical protein
MIAFVLLSRRFVMDTGPFALERDFLTARGDVNVPVQRSTATPSAVGLIRAG